MAQITCPECGHPADDQDFACGNCEVILNPQAPGGKYIVTQPSIVRALLSPADHSGAEPPKRPAPTKAGINDQVTVRSTIVLDHYTIPRLVAGLDVARHPLHPFEAHVAAFVDGSTSVPDLARAAEISNIEAQAVIQSLLQRKVLELHRQEPRPAAPPPPPPAEDSPPPQLSEEPATEGHGIPALGAAPPPAARPRTPAQALAPPAPTTKPLPKAELALPRITAPIGEPVRSPGQQVTPARAAAPAAATPGRGNPAAVPPRATPSKGVGPSAPPSSPPTAKQEPRSGGFRPLPNLGPGLEPANAAKSALEAAVALERRGEVDGAIEVLKRAIARVPQPAPLYNKLALIVLNQRRAFRQAEELLNKAMELEPDNSVYQQNLMKVYELAASVDRKPKEKGLLSKLLKK